MRLFKGSIYRKAAVAVLMSSMLLNLNPGVFAVSGGSVASAESAGAVETPAFAAAKTAAGTGEDDALLLAAASAWDVNLASGATVSTSFISSWETLNAIKDGHDPTSSTDKTGGAYGNWNNASAAQWVQYEWPAPVHISKSDVYWWTDNGGILAPTASKLQFWDGSAFVDVPAAIGGGVALNTYNTTTFYPVETTRLRMTVIRGAQWTGILEWKVYATPAVSIKPVKLGTPIGVQPALPTKAVKILADGSAVEAAVVWPTVTAEQLAQAGSFRIEGDVEGTDLQAEAAVYVRASGVVTITAVAEENISTWVGKAPRLPSVVEATYDDGSVDNISSRVTWNPYDPDLLKQPGQFTVAGSVTGTSIEAKANVTVTEPSVMTIADSSVSTVAGKAPVLPAKVMAVYNNATTASLDVVWDAVTPEQYAAAGSFTVNGMIAGTPIKAKASVTVIAKAVVSYEPFPTVYTVVGVAPVMPAVAVAVYNDGSKGQVTGVTWPAITPSSYAATGMFTTANPTIPGRPSSVARPGATVIVLAIAALHDAYAVTEAGTAPVFPAAVQASMSDGTVRQLSAAWNSPAPSQYAQKGVFSVNGTVAGASGPVKTIVTVLSAGAAAVSLSPVSVETLLLAQPALPGAVPARYSDGTDGYASVVWDDVPGSQYEAVGEFTVAGTVAGFSAARAEAKVTVVAPVITGYKPVATITTPRTAPVLPARVTALYGNGTTGTVDVVWAPVSLSAYAQPGTFHVTGAAAGSDLPVAADVTVAEPNRSTRIGNPLLTNIFTADPGALTYRNTFYIYAGHDEAPRTATDFLMNDWHILSSTDMQHWNDNGPAMRYEVFSWASGQAYAGQTIEKNGKFYWYCPVGTSSGFAIGVAVSDSPLGPWKDARGTSLINSTTVNGSALNIDPTIFTDTDGQTYLYWGSYNTVRMIKLNSDMISYSEPVITPVGLTRYWEAPYLNKIGDKYYFSYAAGANPATIDYAMSDSPAGPWTYKGTINDVTSSPTNHDAIQFFRGKYYFVYHTSDVSGGFDYQRNIAVDLITVNPDGTLNKVVQTKTGPGPAAVDGNIAYFASTSASYSSVEDTILALNDGYEPDTSRDRSKDVFSTRSGKQWVQYEWSEARTIDSVDLYWYDDGAGTRVPASYKLEFWNGSSFEAVPHADGYGVQKDRFNTTKFDMVTTTKLRLELTGSAESGTGIEEWRVNDPKTVVSIDGPVSVHTPAGTPAVLPETLTANTIDGKKKNVTIQWASVPSSNYASPRQFQVEGMLADSDARVEAIVTVDPVQGQVYISGLTETKTATMAGTAPVLPPAVKASYTDHSYKDAAVVWNTVDPALYKLPGQFAVEGMVVGTDLKAKVTVVVTMDPAKPNLALKATASATHAQGGTAMHKNINDGADPASSRATPNYNNWPNFGTETAELAWSTPVSVNRSDVYWFADGNAGGVKAPVSAKLEYWNGTAFVPVANAQGNGLLLNQYNMTTFDAVTTTRLRLTFTGTGTEATGILEWKAFAANPVKSVQTVSVDTEAKSAPQLPPNVTAVYMNDSTAELAVAWDAVQPVQYAQAGEFTVYGTVTGTDQPARAIVTVHDAGGGTLTGPESVAGGQPFELTLAVNGAGADVLALDATVTFDGDKVEWIGTGDILKDGLALVGEDAKPGKVRLILANIGETRGDISGNLLRLQFKAKDTGAAGTAGFAVASLTAADSTGAETGLAGGSWTVSIRHIDKTALAAVIAEAQAAHDAAAEGTAAGQYPAGSKAELQAAIDDAKAVAADSAATDEQVEQAAASLAESLQAFRDAVIKTRPGDMNDDDKVTVGDLAIIAAAYGRTAADPNWPQYAKSDLNADGLIDIEDLSAMARLIFG